MYTLAKIIQSLFIEDCIGCKEIFFTLEYSDRHNNFLRSTNHNTVRTTLDTVILTHYFIIAVSALHMDSHQRQET